jgi:hypothetical protein
MSRPSGYAPQQWKLWPTYPASTEIKMSTSKAPGGNLQCLLTISSLHSMLPLELAILHLHHSLNKHWVPTCT